MVAGAKAGNHTKGKMVISPPDWPVAAAFMAPKSAIVSRLTMSRMPKMFQAMTA